MKTLALGEILFDQIDGLEYLGGTAVNVAVHLSRLGEHSHILSALGADKRGNRALKFLKDEALDLKYCQLNSFYDTGLVEVHLEQGIPTYNIIENSAWDHICPPFFKALERESFDAIYCGTLGQRTSENYTLFQGLLDKLEYKELFFDVNLRQNYYSRESVHETMKHTTILKLNEEEFPVICDLLYEETLKEETFFKKISQDYGVNILLLTLGGEGSVIFHHSLDPLGLKVPCGKAKLVDTVGAGDSFSATFLHFYLQGSPIKEAAQKATLMAAYIVSQQGALPPLDL